MLELEEAVARILAAIPPARKETVSLGVAHRRVLLERVVSPCDLPLFDNSAMDGYAVRADDVASARAEAAVCLKVAGRVAAGENISRRITSGECVRVFTGSALPAGADAVVMQEDTRTEPGKPHEVLITDSVKPWENVRLRGEDLRTGAPLVEPGVGLTAGRLHLLAATGVEQVHVGRQPLVGLLATGSELREPGADLKPGQIYESNRLGLAALIPGAGGSVRSFPLVPDNLSSTRAALERAFEKCDIVITTGGVSVGEMDFVKPAFADAGGKLQFWKIAIKPGRPFVYGQWKGKILFGLPGNPVSALVTFLLLVRPALLCWQGAAEVSLASCTGELAEPLNNQGPRRHFMRVKMADDGKVHSAGAQASHILSSLAVANGLLDVPPDTILLAGASVQVLRWEG